MSGRIATRGLAGIGALLLVVSIVGFVGSVLWRSFGGDYDKYGRVAIPGSSMVTLPKGEVDILFATTFASNGGGGALTVPQLSFDLVPPNGDPDPRVTEDYGSTVSVNNHAHIRVWRMQVPTAGRYAVTTDGAVDGYIQPELTFGTGSTAPTWTILASVALFFVALGMVLVGGLFAQHRKPEAPAGAAAVPAPMTTGPPVPYGERTPEQELARLNQLQQLTDLHTAGTLSDSEYADARSRLGS